MNSTNRLRRRVACANDRFHVFLDDIESPGERGVREYLVVEPKESADNLVTGVAVLPICGGEMGLIKIHRYAIQADSWEIPRGFVEHGETTAVSALRELQEETGLTCDPVNLKRLGFITPDSGILAARIEVYAGLKCVRYCPFSPVEAGHREFRLFDVANVADLISSSELQDPSTLFAFYRYLQLSKLHLFAK